jgi:hypothetical protein
VIEPRPRSLVDQEGVQPGFADRRIVFDERLEQGLVAGPHLFEEQRVHHLRRAHHVCERLALVRRQRRDVGGEIGWRKAGGLLLQLRHCYVDGRCRWRGRRRGRRLRTARREGCDK